MTPDAETIKKGLFCLSVACDADRRRKVRVIGALSNLASGQFPGIEKYTEMILALTVQEAELINSWNRRMGETP